MSTIDRRIAVRRRQVAEDHARSRLRTVLLGIGLAVAIGAVVWAAQSPLLDVDRIEVTGVTRSGASATLEALEIEPGMPMIAVRAGTITDALESDPWVADATVLVVWPNRIEIQVSERIPASVVSSAAGSWLVSTDGVVLAARTEPGRPVIALPGGGALTIGAVLDGDLAGAAEFAAALPARFSADATVAVDGDGVTAVVAGHVVRLGPTVDMAEKARVVAAIVDTGPVPGSVIDVLAPSRPVIVAPELSPDEPTTETEGTG